MHVLPRANNLKHPVARRICEETREREPLVWTRKNGKKGWVRDKKKLYLWHRRKKSVTNVKQSKQTNINSDDNHVLYTISNTEHIKKTHTLTETHIHSQKWKYIAMLYRRKQNMRSKTLNITKPELSVGGRRTIEEN